MLDRPGTIAMSSVGDGIGERLKQSVTDEDDPSTVFPRPPASHQVFFLGARSRHALWIIDRYQ